MELADMDMTAILGALEGLQATGRQSQDTIEGDMAWGEISESTVIVCHDVMKEIIESKETIPDCLLEAATVISDTSGEIDSLHNHQDDFRRLLGGASCLVVVLWQSYKTAKYPQIWPRPELKRHIKMLVETLERVYTLMKRKSENVLAKRILFSIRDLTKFKKYQRRLDSVATGLEGKPNNIDINGVLAEFIKSRQTHAKVPEETKKDVSPTKKSTNPKAVIQEPVAESSRSRNAEKSTSSNQKVISEAVEEGNQRESKGLGKKKGKKQTKPKTRPEDESVEERSEEPEEEGTSEEDSQRAKKATRSKTKNRASQAYEYEEDMGRVPVSSPGVAKAAPKKKKTNPPPRPKARSQTLPASAISGFAFNNSGSGTMTNHDVGNIYNSNISGVGNDYSVNHFHGRRKRPYD